MRVDRDEVETREKKVSRKGKRKEKQGPDINVIIIFNTEKEIKRERDSQTFLRLTQIQTAHEFYLLPVDFYYLPASQRRKKERRRTRLTRSAILKYLCVSGQKKVYFFLTFTLFYPNYFY